jgi:hypothetical protein
MTANMEFANDLLAGLRGKVQAAPAGAQTPGFDWPGLHARLTAAHAARYEISKNESPRAAPAGGFAQWCGIAASPGKSLPDVNRTDSADGKAPAGMESAIAGSSGAGGRGQE